MYKCLNDQCGQTFLHTAKLLETVLSIPDLPVKTKDSSVCPFCESKAYEEVVEAKPINLGPQPESVILFEFKNAGAQPDLDKLLQDGYIVKEVYAKQYHLWKLKPQ